MFYYVYVLLCFKKSREIELYIGSCNDLKKRYKKHKNKKVKTTLKFNTITLVYYEACLNKKDAIKRERQLKTGFGRGYLKRRIKNYLESLRM